MQKEEGENPKLTRVLSHFFGLPRLFVVVIPAELSCREDLQENEMSNMKANIVKKPSPEIAIRLAP